MSIDMYLSLSEEQAQSVEAVLARRQTAYQSLQETLIQLISNSPDLSGRTYDSAKAYSSQVLIPLLKGCMLLDEAIITACKRLPSEYRSQVDQIDLKESDLVERIAQFDHVIGRYMDLISIEYSREEPSYSYISHLRSAEQLHRAVKRRLEEILRRLRHFDTNSVHLFSTIQTLAAAVQIGMRQARTSWHAGSQVFVISEDMAWADTINSKWSKSKGLSHLGDYVYDPDVLAKGVAISHPWIKTGYTMSKNFGKAVSKDYTKASFLSYGKAGKRASDDLNLAWRDIRNLARQKHWAWYERLGHKWKKGSFSQLLNTFQKTILKKISDFKVFGKYSIKQISTIVGKVTDPIKSSIESLGKHIKNSRLFNKMRWIGKAAKATGWTSMAVDTGITSVREYNKKNSRAYGSEGKALIHASVAQIKSMGPIEGAIIGSKAGPWGALMGFVTGGINVTWGVVHPDSKDNMFLWIQDKMNDAYDSIAQTDLGKGTYHAKESVKGHIGRAIIRTWDFVSQSFDKGVGYGS
ncbi:TPA: hypothetical protein TT553_000969 [Streptococcus equi subsp. zooepidemicus]|uniref:Membrane protein n=1 Tax=Streptococcus equi subsp. zooepidemicus TaxID=40041 RepID=A0A7Z8ZYC9_STRSZ|nr:hypothetical protein [Streptococcus equi]VEF09227.1 membrane protein [Streptococcus equi subsp. zooepidemicus]HEK9984113.1 hypothetical protein [Streptococcus equi subsp. zooepidemicus]HEL0610788.1 hypothetical protein [Streptococcus equi subsp. zooepidemicus]HEL0636655.1 hypothetical protein [Streptococcus equi subsp. zooepidemicus]HEL0652648.1 hypothetical protein [Streptococcus equi subsp. zooepidemicus]